MVPARKPFVLGMLVLLLLITAVAFLVVAPVETVGHDAPRDRASVGSAAAGGAAEAWAAIPYQPRMPIETSGHLSLLTRVKRWEPGASLRQISDIWADAPRRALAEIDGTLESAASTGLPRINLLLAKVGILNSQGETERAYDLLSEIRSRVEKDDSLGKPALYTIIYCQGVTALRRGETENCVMCRGESSCILPIAPAAVHTNPAGSRLAIRHFTEYLRKFPDDLGVRWLLNLAHMTLGEYPQGVEARFLVPLDHYLKSEFDIGKFRDIGHLAGVNRFNMAGGAVLEDFDNDGRLDLATSTYDSCMPMAYYRNKGDGTFEERTKEAGLIEQLGGKYLVQTDYNNDGWMDLYVSRGAWYPYPVRQSLLRNNGDGTFRDVTEEAGLVGPVDSPNSRWADYDNDGWLDVFLDCETQSNRLYHNRGDGTFEDVTAGSGLAQNPDAYCKGANWIDYDNDNYPDLFIDNLKGDARLYHNERNGTFVDVTRAMGVDGPRYGFSCWAWDYDNDGWLDIFATCYDYSLDDVVKGLMGKPHDRQSNRLFRNVGGKRFEDKTKEAGLDMVFATMGSNFGDVDNDGFLDFYLGTGDPDYSLLVPNRLFKNVDGRRFAEITASSGTGHLQKGHGVSFADWDRDGDVDLFIQMGGGVPGDRYHNILFQNPGQGNHWLTVKLVGKKTNRAAIGARIKVITAGERPLTVQRHVSSGSSWGANPLEQHIGLARAGKVALLEIHWPTSGTTQVFRDIAADQAIEVTEFANDYRKLDWKPITAPK